MKKIITILLAFLITNVSFAAGNDVEFRQWNNANTVVNIRIPAHPTSAPGVLF